MAVSFFPQQSLAANGANMFDFDGDNIADLAVYRQSSANFYIFKSTGRETANDAGDDLQRIQLGSEATDIPVAGDFDGDGLWDVGIRRPGTFEWHIRHSSTGDIVTTRFGLDAGDIPVPADYDGDGITDIAVRRPETFTWYILNSSGVDDRTNHEDGISRVVFGTQSDDIPVPADYDGDGKADIAVRRPSTFYWYIQNSDGSNFNSDRGDGIQRVLFGQNASDIPVPADFTGDGKADIAVRRPATFTWFIKNSDGSNLNSDRQDGIQRIVFGQNEADSPMPADYDGDGIADLATRRPGNDFQVYYIKNSSGTNYNSDRNDGIQRVRFEENENEVPLAQGAYQNFLVGQASDEPPTIWSEASFAVSPMLDVTYAQGLSHSAFLSDTFEEMDLKLDIYQPVGLVGKKPAYIFVHGGGFKGGDKSQTGPLRIVEHMVQRGFVGISLNYRVLGDFGSLPVEWSDLADSYQQQGLADEEQANQIRAIYPAVRDVKAALRWVFANAQELGIDTRYVTLAGGSAGGSSILAAANAFDSDYRDELDLEADPTLSSTNLGTDYQFKNLVNFWGGSTATELPQLVFGGDSRWDANDVPLCHIHGTADTTVLYSEALKVQGLYEENNIPHQLFTLEGVGHGQWGSTYEGKSLAELALECILSYQDLQVQ